MAFKVYTKTGDKGMTALFGGARVPKDHIRIESYGTVDELNSYIGLVRDSVEDESIRKGLLEIQNRLFTVGAILATDPSKQNIKTPDLFETDVKYLEDEIDMMENTLTPLKNFILPGGNTAVSYCHIARCVCRRAERLCVALNHIEPLIPIVIKYMNRLSDYLFVLSRFIGQINKLEEIPWISRK
ncbi:MAG: cob(I)yrinic acid a,c-diamide adenosyltransferase [Saprospiraceae bacterium]|nr:cob(I)yrinic acid a,c-diamide adenosyltransferase [Saprospiraceae bacterium]